MMNINEDKKLNTDYIFEGNVQEIIKVQNDAPSFKYEFDKLLDNGVELPFIAQNSLINPILDFENFGDIEEIKIDTKEIENADAMFF